jgi:hypothetical protein
MAGVARRFLKLVPSSVVSADLLRQFLNEAANTDSRYECSEALSSNVVNHHSPQEAGFPVSGRVEPMASQKVDQ